MSRGLRVVLAGAAALLVIAPPAWADGDDTDPAADPPVPTASPAPDGSGAQPAPTQAGPSSTPGPTPGIPEPTWFVIGRSVEGRDLVAVRAGDPAATRVLVVLGQMHGDEAAGPRVVQAVRRMPVPDGVQVWTIDTLNPDGASRGTRVNARGVDLNRNFPYGWRPTSTSPLYHPGSARASEPETRALMDLFQRIRPDAVVSFHQAFDAVDVSLAKTAPYARRLARWIGLRTVRVPCRGPCAGTMTGWVNARLPGMAITVELPATVPASLVRRSASAALRLGGIVPDA